MVSRQTEKHQAELRFQRNWAAEFPLYREKVREYWLRYRFLNEILERIRLSPSGRVLDVGCGISSVLHYLPGRRFGIDPLARQYHGLYSYPDDMLVLAGAGEAIPFRDGIFEAVFCSNAIDHTEAPEAVVESIGRVLAPEGHFVLTVELFDQAGDRGGPHPHSLGEADVAELLAASFRVVFKRASRWIGLRNYAGGRDNPKQTDELVVVAKKV